MSQLQRLVVSLDQISGQQLVLTHEQYHYLSRVLRLRSGDRFITIDGQGQSWLSEINADATTAQLLEPVSMQTELPISIRLLVALPKGNGMDDVVRQVTELGVTEIVPVFSDRTLLNPSTQKLERWRRIAQEAAEQSERQLVPQIHQPTTLAQVLADAVTPGVKRYICVARGHYPHMLEVLSNQNEWQDSKQSICIATGPEGGWTDAEVNQAIAACYQPVSLGNRILRAVTAPLVAVSLAASVFEWMPNH